MSSKSPFFEVFQYFYQINYSRTDCVVLIFLVEIRMCIAFPLAILLPYLTFWISVELLYNILISHLSPKKIFYLHYSILVNIIHIFNSINCSFSF